MALGDAMNPGAKVSVRRRPTLSIGDAFIASLKKFGPRSQLHNPIMFVVYIFFFFLLAATFTPWLFPDLDGPGYDPMYYLTLTMILFVTLWFANIAEALAEAQARAQADSLKEVRSGLQARQILPDGSRRWVSSSHLHSGDHVEIKAGEVVPMDGDVVHGGALIDESMMTGESEPVVRESGGDKTSVIGGARVMQGSVEVRITAEPGFGFLDKMIRLVEGTTRDKSPNEVALTILLSALTAALLVVVVSLAYLLGFRYPALFNLGTLIALIVCLIPTTIGGLLSAIGISGINRVTKANVVVKSGKAVEAAGDLDVLILDKTGTITVGNRLAVQFIPVEGVEPPELMKWAITASALDDTPEGRSIIRLAGLKGVLPDRIDVAKSRVIPFSPERKMSGLITPEGTEYMKGAISAISSYVGSFPAFLSDRSREAASAGMTPLAICVDKRVVGLVILKDVVKPGIRDRLRELKVMGIRTVMCTGDNRLTAQAIAIESGVDSFVPEAKPEQKLSIIQQEKAMGRLVAMSGDGTNDAPALARADVGLAMNSGTSAAKEAANMVDLDSDPTKLIEVVSIGKQLLITRGALTTFSITNDVAKYFAIIPAVFVGFAGISELNVMQLTNPHIAVIAALLFNALMIPILIPIALRGASFRPQSAVELLRRNLLIYGVGGLVSAFIGIKLCYIGVLALFSNPTFIAVSSAVRQGVLHL
jgi:K+-transporting ATPase ATPase B chain